MYIYSDIDGEFPLFISGIFFSLSLVVGVDLFALEISIFKLKANPPNTYVTWCVSLNAFVFCGLCKNKCNNNGIIHIQFLVHRFRQFRCLLFSSTWVKLCVCLCSHFSSSTIPEISVERNECDESETCFCFATLEIGLVLRILWITKNEERKMEHGK